MIGGKPAKKDLAHAGLAAQKAAYEFGKLAAAAITRDLELPQSGLGRKS